MEAIVKADRRVEFLDISYGSIYDIVTGSSVPDYLLGEVGEVCDVKSASLRRKHRLVSNLRLLMGSYSTNFAKTPDARLHTEYRTSW
ncbi:hypothetical protein TNIN_292621 [Trichonephila inaurata madagascariensis]|uniref:Uncharacterized protein n=1 Tax=Trichonephila inaurata madagascariensis TaxID=2747483 RepID=A0A8X7C2B9_9ARAC|nr:hypothetical protein TNIN_292621 [Trichonephila inaurata madagascariensis]